MKIDRANHEVHGVHPGLGFHYHYRIVDENHGSPLIAFQLINNPALEKVGLEFQQNYHIQENSIASFGYLRDFEAFLDNPETGQSQLFTPEQSIGYNTILVRKGDFTRFKEGKITAHELKDKRVSLGFSKTDYFDISRTSYISLGMITGLMHNSWLLEDSEKEIVHLNTGFPVPYATHTLYQPEVSSFLGSSYKETTTSETELPQTIASLRFARKLDELNKYKKHIDKKPFFRLNNSIESFLNNWAYSHPAYSNPNHSFTLFEYHSDYPAEKIISLSQNLLTHAGIENSQPVIEKYYWALLVDVAQLISLHTIKDIHRLDINLHTLAEFTLAQDSATKKYPHLYVNELGTLLDSMRHIDKYLLHDMLDKSLRQDTAQKKRKI